MSSPSSPQGIVNSNFLLQPEWRTLMAKGRAGVVTPVLVIGDSIGFGYGSAAVSTGHRMNGLGPQLARALNGVGIRAQAQGFFGDNGMHAAGTSRQYDSRLSGTGGGIGVTSMGGASFVFASAGDGTLTFTPSQSVDTLQIYAYQFGGAGTMSYKIDSGAAVNFSLNNTNGLYAPAAISLGSLASHTISYTWVSGSPCYLLGMNCYDSSIGGLQFLNAATPGGQTSDLTPNTNAYYALRIGAALAPALTIIVIGANHWNNGLSPLTFRDDLETVVKAYSKTGLVALVSDVPTVTGTYTTPLKTQLDYISAMRSVAVAYECVFFDLWSYFGGMSASASDGNWLADGIHPNQQGYGLASGLLARALSQV